VTRPLKYETLTDVRFSDYDPYGHVNARNYLDLVLASRWRYAQTELGVTADDFIRGGLGFFLIRSEIDYLKPIERAYAVHVSSHVESAAGVRLRIPFVIEDGARTMVHSRGLLIFAIMDLASQRPCGLPDWTRKYFFHVDEAP
jgi:acyl-CoA thioester hydrolase